MPYFVFRLCCCCRFPFISDKHFEAINLDFLQNRTYKLNPENYKNNLLSNFNDRRSFMHVYNVTVALLTMICTSKYCSFTSLSMWNKWDNSSFFFECRKYMFLKISHIYLWTQSCLEQNLNHMKWIKLYFCCSLIYPTKYLLYLLIMTRCSCQTRGLTLKGIFLE